MKKTTILTIAIAIVLFLALVYLFIKPNHTLSNNEKLPRLQVSIDDDPVKGPDDAPVTIIEFGDFQCMFSRKFSKEVLPLIEENYIKTGKVKFVFRNFVLSSFPYSQKAAEASECAGEQGKFWEYYNMLFENQQALEVADLKRYAEGLLDTSEFNDCLDSGEMADEVKKDRKEGESYGVLGTPTLFINGIFVKGPQSYEKTKRIIEEELAR